MAEENNPSNAPPNRPRRSSFAGQTFADLFGNGSGSGHRGSISRANGENNSPPAQQYGSPIATAAAQAQRRRLSLTTLGLSASPNSTSPFGSYRGRRDSDLNSANSASIDESAIEDDFGGPNPTPQTPFGRRVSFGAKALRDVRTGGGNGGNGGTSPGQNGSYEGFNWSENFRSRAERTASIGGNGSQIPTLGSSGGPQNPPHHSRAKSVAVMDSPIHEMPKAKEQVRPDHFQERILKGDFYMD